jgi:hypothetical protein
MQRATARAMGSRPVTGRLVLALVLAGVIGGVAAAPARADDERGRDPHERLDRERAARDEWRDHRRRPVYVAPPSYVYAPPPVVYAPPPPSGINLIFPLNIR